MIRTTLSIMAVMAYAALIIASVLYAPRCTPQSPDGTRVGEMLVHGCDRSAR